MNEKKLIQQILKGDTSAFGWFVDTYQDMAITIAYRICRNRQDAEDIVQNAFVKAFHNLNHFRLDSKFSTWLYKIVYNTTVSHIQSAVFKAEYFDYESELINQTEDWSILSQIDEKERNELLQIALNKIPEGESLLLTLFYMEEYSIKEIEDLTGLSQSNIKVRLHRARKSLKDVLEKENIKFAI